MTQQVYSISPLLVSETQRSTGHTNTLSYTVRQDWEQHRSAERGNGNAEKIVERRNAESRTGDGEGFLLYNTRTRSLSTGIGVSSAWGTGSISEMREYRALSSCPRRRGRPWEPEPQLRVARPSRRCRPSPGP